jgi:hypothetical protein
MAGKLDDEEKKLVWKLMEDVGFFRLYDCARPHW